MAIKKRACIIYVEADGCNPGAMAARLEEQGYEVTLCPVSAEQAKDVEDGVLDDLSDEIRHALIAADLCVFLVSQRCNDSGEYAAAAQCAVSGGADILGVWPEGEDKTALPMVLVDYGCDVLGENAPEIDEVMSGTGDSWKNPSGESADSAKSEHQRKC